MKKESLVWIGLALVLVVVLTAASCKRAAPVDNTIDNTIDTSEEDQTNDDTNGDNDPDFTPYPGTGLSPGSGLPNPDTYQAVLTRETQDATDFIRLIRPDAVLIAVAAKYINSLSNTFGLSTNYYIFSSASDHNFYYLVNVPRNGLDSMKRFLMPVQDFDLDFDLLPIPFQYWQINCIKALLLAETQGGGSQFRTNHKTFEVSTILAIPVGQHLTWSITYKATDGSGGVLQVQVHANTGEVQIII